MDLADELIGRAHDLVPTIAKRAAATEQNRAPLDETIDDLCEAGFMEVLVPKCLGGHELHVDTMVAIARILSTACMSTGWITAFYIGHNWLHAVFPQESQKQVFKDARYNLSAGQIAPTAKARRVPGGFEVSGQQSWSSGSVHSEWFFFTGLLLGEDGPLQPWMFCIPRKDVTIIDNWFIAGMSGTGSRDVEVQGLFVPEYQAVRFGALLDGTHPGSQIHKSPLYRLPAATVLLFETIPVLCGGMRGATELFVNSTKDRVASYTGTGVAAKASAQMRAGRAVASAEVIEAITQDAVDFVLSLKGDRPLTIEERAYLKMRAAIITKFATDGINDIAHGAGGNAFRDDSPLQRFFRDVNVLRNHAALEFEGASEIYGRVRLGMDAGAPV